MGFPQKEWDMPFFYYSDPLKPFDDMFEQAFEIYRYMGEFMARSLMLAYQTPLSK